MNSLRLRLASTCGTRLGTALGRFGGSGAAYGGRRSVSATSSAAASVPGDQGVGMDPAKQHQQPPPHAPEEKQQTEHGDVMTDSFGEGYWTRCDEEGFGGVYGQNEHAFSRKHPEYDTSQGSEVKEKEKGRHLHDGKHAT